MRRWILRPLGWLSGAVLVLMLLLAAAIRFDQYVLRWRAERLQADIRSLELRKSTYADARRLEERWFDNTKVKVCRPSWCDLSISVNNMPAQHLQFFLEHPVIVAVYHALGGRVAGASAFVEIRDNVLWGKGIGVGIDTLETEPNGRHVQYELEASIATGRFPFVPARHPEYEIGGPSACTSCKAGWVYFTPFANPRVVLRLTDLNFTCITRWRQCTEQADILPTAWKELRAEAAEDGQYRRECTPAMIRVLSRQIHSVDLVKVIKVERAGEFPMVKVRRLTDGLPQFTFQRQEQEFPLSVDPSEGIRLGDKLLLLGDTCGDVPATPENLAAARLGASEGWIPPRDTLGLPFGTPDAPKIDVR